MQEITIEGELRTYDFKYLLPYYSWKHVCGEKEQIKVRVFWEGPMSTLLQRNDLKNTVLVSEPKSEKIKFNFKVGNDILGYAIYNCSSKNWQEGHISKILDVDNYMIRVADKMKKIIDLVGKVDTLIRIVDYDRYESDGDVSQLVTDVDSLIDAKNNELSKLNNTQGIIPNLISYNGNSYEKIDNRADIVIRFLKSEKYKECIGKPLWKSDDR